MGFDLCVLASSDHTLITYGTFGLWGAILSRGDVIAAKGTNNETYSEVNLQLNIYFTYLCQYCILSSTFTILFVFSTICGTGKPNRKTGHTLTPEILTTLKFSLKSMTTGYNSLILLYFLCSIATVFHFYINETGIRFKVPYRRKCL